MRAAADALEATPWMWTLAYGLHEDRMMVRDACGVTAAEPFRENLSVIELACRPHHQNKPFRQDCVAEHVGFEPANLCARHLIGFA